jgi:thiosulfate/3-mercaptopyruvate sulfurtransferase
MFLSFGHRNVKILEGGLKKWRAEGRAVEAGHAKPTPGRYSAAMLDAGMIRSKAQLVANLAVQAEQVIDARATGRFDGSVAEPRAGLRSGHIPGSRNLPYNLLFNAETSTMKSLAELRQAFETAGLDLARPVVTTCGSGVSAAVLTLALYRLGVRGSALYDGSWSEWGLQDGPPVATGAA